MNKKRDNLEIGGTPLSVTEGKKHRLLLVCSHPVQFAAPVWRLMAQHPHLDITVAFCSMQGVEPGIDPEFGVEVAWDVPLLEGYRSIQIPNKFRQPTLGRFFGLVNPGLWRLVRHGKFDAVLVYGYAYLSYWIAILAAKSVSVPVIIATDTVRLETPYGGWWWKRWVKRPVIRFIYRQVANTIAVPSTATRLFLRSLGVPEHQMVLTHYTVDNDFFENASQLADRSATRQEWGISDEAFVVLYCAKVVPWKRPRDLIAAFALLRDSDTKFYDDAYLVLAGEGQLRQELEREVQALGIVSHVRFLGFVNQSKLPGVYAASSLLVLPSQNEAWGLVINEAMACGLPVVVSDRVGARLDLVVPGVTGEVYPVGDVQALAKILRALLSDREKLGRMKDATRERLSTWSYREHVQGIVEATTNAVRTRS